MGGASMMGGRSGAAGDGGTSHAGGSAGGTKSLGGEGGASGSGVAGTSDGGSQDSGGDGGANAGSEYGFTYHVPGDKNLDWLCTFNEGGEVGHVYVRLLQTGTQHLGLAETPVYAAELAQISLKGQVSALEAAAYEYGGGHHNDSLSFDYGGKSHRYYHSSFGFGFRSCQPMDCRDVYALGTTTLETEGCAKDRSLPEVCVSIKPDGTHEPLVDAFMKCAGDTQ